MSGKQIAVLMSAYNGEKYIEKQIESILNQDGIDSLAIIVRNDGSKDGTMNVLRKLQGESECITIIDGKNIGLVASFLELLRFAVHIGFDYYSFSDQDDYWLPEKLHTAIEVLEGHEEPSMYASCSRIVDDNLEPGGTITQTKVREITFFNSAIQNFCPGHNQVLNHALAELVVKKTNYCPMIYSQDMWITTAASVTGRILFDNTPHTLYRQHANNQLSFGKNRIGWVKDHLKRLKKGEGRKIAIQLRYFCDCFNDFLTDEQKDEIKNFFDSQKSFSKRLGYIRRTKLYRQKDYETSVFKIIYLMGGYDID